MRFQMALAYPHGWCANSRNRKQRRTPPASTMSSRRLIEPAPRPRTIYRNGLNRLGGSGQVDGGECPLWVNIGAPPTNVRFTPKADIGRCGWVRLIKLLGSTNATCRGAPPTSDDSGEVSASRVHLAVRLPRSHMMMSGGSDKSVDARGESSNK